MSSIEERDEAICRAYTEDKVPAERLAIQYGLGVSSVWKILKKRGAKRPEGPPVKRSPVEKILGDSHLKIGYKLTHYRSFELVADRTALANKLGWSVKKIAAVEQGKFNLSLIDLQDLATLFKVPLTRLLDVLFSNAPSTTPESTNPGTLEDPPKDSPDAGESESKV